MRFDKRFWKKHNNIKIFLVNGYKVRNSYVSFGIGGHHKAYDYIPKNEIWIEKSVTPKERNLILLHELYERKRMIDDNWDYLRAHFAATQAESYARKYPSKVMQKIKDILE